MMFIRYILLIVGIVAISSQIVLSEQLEQPNSVNEWPNSSINKNILNEIEKEKIRFEEIYREEVRQSLKEKNKQPNYKKILTFLNTGLGLWLLSFILITVSGKIVSKWMQRLKEQAETQTLIRKLDSEIYFRLDSIKMYHDKKYVGTMSQSGFLILLDTTSSMFPEFNSRSLKSLIGELAYLLPKGSERQQVVSVTKNLNAIGLKIENSDPNADSEFIKSIIEEYESHIRIKRWKLE